MNYCVNCVYYCNTGDYWDNEGFRRKSEPLCSHHSLDINLITGRNTYPTCFNERYSHAGCGYDAKNFKQKEPYEPYTPNV